jgi:hypothetical protein
MYDENTKPLDVETLKKAELRDALKASLQELTALRDSLGRMLRTSAVVTPARHRSHDDDFVPSGWAEQHGIHIPRSDGLFESPTAWVKLAHGVITGAGLKNQSILSMMISLRLVDAGEERSAMLYADWKTAFLSGVDPVKWTVEESHGTPGAWSKEDRYSKLLHRVDQDCLFAMDAMVTSKPKAKHLSAFRSNQPKFVAAFKIVVNAIRAINQEAEKELEKSRKAGESDAGCKKTDPQAIKG